MGELLAEFMRPTPGMTLSEHGTFVGPFPSGAPAIFIDTAARLGHSAAIIGGVGDDDFGTCIVDRLRSDGVSTEYVSVISGRSTAVSFVTYFTDGSRKFIFHIDGTPAVMAPVPGPAAANRAKFFHIMGCSLLPNRDFRDRILRTMELFANAGARITFDPNIRPEMLRDGGAASILEPVLRRCSILFPGEDELRLLSGREDIEAGAQALIDGNPQLIIALKQGHRGCTVFTANARIAVPAYPIQAVDPTGAGDCFDAAFLCAQLDGKDLATSARIAAAAGALNAQAFGPMEGGIDPQSIGELMRRHDQSTGVPGS